MPLSQSYFDTSKKVRLNFKRYFIIKIPSKKEFQQIAFNHSSGIDSWGFRNLYKKCTAKTYSFLVNDITLASDNHLCVRKIIQKLIMTIYDVIKNKKLQDDINGVAARISVLSSGNIGKYEYLRGQEILPSS